MWNYFPAVSRQESGPVISTAVREPFPGPAESAQIVDIPTYHPSAEQFQDPITYIDSIEADAESFGICCVVPPDGWKVRVKCENCIVGGLVLLVFKYQNDTFFLFFNSQNVRSQKIYDSQLRFNISTRCKTGKEQCKHKAKSCRFAKVGSLALELQFDVVHCAFQVGLQCLSAGMHQKALGISGHIH